MIPTEPNIADDIDICCSPISSNRKHARGLLQMHDKFRGTTSIASKLTFQEVSCDELAVEFAVRSKDLHQELGCLLL